MINFQISHMLIVWDDYINDFHNWSEQICYSLGRALDKIKQCLFLFYFSKQMPSDQFLPSDPKII